MERHTTYFKKNTKIKNFTPIPRFIFKENLTSSAKIIYSLLVARTMLSQKEENVSRWSDALGRVYVNYTIRNLAIDSGLGEQTVKNALAQLKEHGLIRSDYKGNNRPNTIYVKYPEGAFPEDDAGGSDSDLPKPSTPIHSEKVDDAGRSMDGPQNLSSRKDNNDPPGEPESVFPERQNQPPIYTKIDRQITNTDRSVMSEKQTAPADPRKAWKIISDTAAKLGPR